MSANSIFRVLAGASRQCALCAASTSPDSASATIQDRADRPFGSTGTPLARLTWVPACPSRVPPTVDIFAGGAALEPFDSLESLESFDFFDFFDGSAVAVAEEPADGLDEGLGAARATGAVSTVDSTMVEMTSSERRMEFLGAGTVGNVHAVPEERPSLPTPRTEPDTVR
ncbi:hypothetical protein SHIRM173S_02599 [Streptomyces hirsutus]